MKYTAEQHNEVIDAIRAALEKLKHHQAWGNGTKFGNALRAALGDRFTTYVATEYNLGKISVWGNGCDYVNRIFLCFNLDACGSWANSLAQEIERNDSRDVQEREEQEQNRVSVFGNLNVKLQEALRAVAAIREQAAQEIARIPEPRCATIRKGHFIWKEPTGRLAAQYPDLFKS